MSLIKLSLFVMSYLLYYLKYNFFSQFSQCNWITRIGIKMYLFKLISVSSKSYNFFYISNTQENQYLAIYLIFTSSKSNGIGRLYNGKYQFINQKIIDSQINHRSRRRNQKNNIVHHTCTVTHECMILLNMAPELTHQHALCGIMDYFAVWF